jgi:hypothetical protein
MFYVRFMRPAIEAAIVHVVFMGFISCSFPCEAWTGAGRARRE